MSSSEIPRVVMFTGKGGVGKSTLAAAWAFFRARRGQRVLLVETSHRSVLRELFEVRHVGFEPLEVADNILAVNLDPDESLIDYMSRHIRVKRLLRSILNNKVVQLFFRTAPAIQEYLFFHQLLYYEGQAEYEHIVVDLPATGHAMTLLKMPWDVSRLFSSGPVFRAAQQYQEFLTNHQRAGVHLVSLPEELPINETCELGENLRSYGLWIRQIYLNKVRPPLLDPHEQQLFDQLLEQNNFQDNPHLQKLLEAGRQESLIRDREGRFSEKLRQRARAPIALIPHLNQPLQQLDDLQQLSYLLEKAKVLHPER